MPSKKNKYNNWLVPDKNVQMFDMEILEKYKGEDVPEDMMIIRVYTKKDECHVLFMPNFEDKKVGLALDQTTPFSDSVLTYLINSGEAEKIMQGIYNAIWGGQSQNDSDILYTM